MLAPLLTFVTLFVSPIAVRASPCVAFDINWNLLAFGLDGKDWNAGTSDTWATGTATAITASGRPPFDGTNTTCYLSQFNNAIYVANGDKSSPSNIHIYDAGAKSWTTQTVTTGSFDPSSFNAILDHDTNEFYALSHGELFRLNMGALKAANSTSLAWVDVEKAPYPSGYQPVMALAENHIFFLNVPGTAAGSADIYVIHFDYFQPAAQAFPTPSGTLPATYGKTASFFQNAGVQTSIAFIPSDSSATYVLNVDTNTTQILAGPTTKDAAATYFAGIDSLVQLDSEGGVMYLPFNANDTNANAAAQWSKVASLATAAPPSSTNSSSHATTSSGAPKSSSSSSSSSGSSSQESANGAVAVASRDTIRVIIGAAVLGAGALLM